MLVLPMLKLHQQQRTQQLDAWPPALHQVVPLPAAALKEAWAEQAHSYLKSRFMVHLDNSGFRYEV